VSDLLAREAALVRIWWHSQPLAKRTLQAADRRIREEPFKRFLASLNIAKLGERLAKPVDKPLMVCIWRG
jgi:hypothetical protein